MAEFGHRQLPFCVIRQKWRILAFFWWVSLADDVGDGFYYGFYVGKAIWGNYGFLAIRSFWRVTCSAHGVDFVFDLAVEHNRKKKVQTKFKAFFSVGTCECDENEALLCRQCSENETGDKAKRNEVNITQCQAFSVCQLPSQTQSYTDAFCYYLFWIVFEPIGILSLSMILCSVSSAAIRLSTWASSFLRSL